MALAVETGVPHSVWLEDPRAMFTAAQLIDDRNRRGK